MWRGLILSLSLLLMLTQPALAQAVPEQAVPLTAATHRIDLSGKMASLKDDGGKLTLTEAATSQDFHALPGELNLGFTQAAIWLRVELARNEAAPKHWLLEITNPLHDEVRLYTREADGAWREHRAGDDVPRSLWAMDYRQIVFPLNINTEAPQTLWLRIVSRNSVSAQVVLWQPDAFHRGARVETLLYGLFFGIYATLLIFHLFFWRWTREPVSGWYAFYIATNCMIALLTVGYFQQVSQWPGIVTDSLLGVLLCGVIWSTTVFASLQLELASVMPRTRRALVNGSALLSATFVALTLGVRYSAGVLPAQMVSLGWGVMLIAIPLWLWRRGHPPARFFAIAFGIFLAGSVLRYLRTLGFVAPSLLTDHSYQIGSIVHMLMMSLVITGRYNTMKREKLAAQAALNESLEAEVLQRTTSLVDEIARREGLEQDLRGALETEKLARQEQRDFVTMVSHEFRTPLAIINSSVHHVEESLGATQDKSRARCGNIKKSARRMTDLMDEYLSLDRMEGETQSLRLAACDVSEVVAGVVAEWPPKLIVLTEADLPKTLLCDWKLLQVALRNLIANGLRHSPEGEALHLRVCGESGGGVRIEVRDTGSGIPNEEIARLFQKYFRGRSALNKPGAGLGLYLVERIAHLHGGTVSVESSQGQGSVFVLVLPGRGVGGSFGSHHD